MGHGAVVSIQWLVISCPVTSDFKDLKDFIDLKVGSGQALGT